eukprot:574173-Pleurochrysis_carterae.AAC.2
MSESRACMSVQAMDASECMEARAVVELRAKSSSAPQTATAAPASGYAEISRLSRSIATRGQAPCAEDVVILASSGHAHECGAEASVD